MWKNVALGIGVLVGLIFIARVFGGAIIYFVHWSQGIHISF